MLIAFVTDKNTKQKQYTNSISNHPQSLRWLCGGLISLLKALKRSIPRPMLSKFMPIIPNKARGSSMPLLNLEASFISLTNMSKWGISRAEKKVTQLRIHSAFTILLSAVRIPAIRRIFRTCRNTECSSQINVRIR